MDYAAMNAKPFGAVSLNIGLALKALWPFSGWSTPKRFINQSHLPERIWRRHSALICASSGRYRLR